VPVQAIRDGLRGCHGLSATRARARTYVKRVLEQSLGVRCSRSRDYATNTKRIRLWNRDLFRQTLAASDDVMPVLVRYYFVDDPLPSGLTGWA
jgi:hypothetical protein